MILLFVLLPMVVGFVALARAYGEVDEEFVHDWAGAHALRLTTANRPLVWWYLRNARVLRTLGVLAAMVLPGVASLALGFDRFQNSYAWSWIFAGHLVGALYAEVALRRPVPADGRSASLDRREVRQYLPARLRFAPVGVALLVVLSAAVLWREGTWSSGRGVIVATAIAAPTVVLVVGALQRWIVRRPQPFTEPELVAADDAIRSQSVHMLAGSGTAVLLSLLATTCLSVGLDAESAVRGTMFAVGMVSIPLSLVFCLYYGHRGWRVRRTPFLREPVAP